MDEREKSILELMKQAQSLGVQCNQHLTAEQKQQELQKLEQAGRDAETAFDALKQFGLI